MVANSSPSPSAAHSVILTGAEKVAVLLLALGKQRAAKLLRRFDTEDFPSAVFFHTMRVS